MIKPIVNGFNRAINRSSASSYIKLTNVM